MKLQHFLLVILITTASIASAKGAIVSGVFHVAIDTGLLAGSTHDGTFSYDDSDISGVGNEFLGNGVGAWNFEFVWHSHTFQVDSNPGYASRLNFADGNISGIEYFLGWEQPTPNFYISFGTFLYESTPDFTDGRGIVSYSVVPEPQSIHVTFVAIAIATVYSFNVRRKRQSDSQRAVVQTS